jgi:hypothetical protein
MCVDRRRHPLEAINNSGAVPQPTAQRQPNNVWTMLPAPQQPACIDSIGDLCASIRRGTVPLLLTGITQPSSPCAEGGRKRHRAANPHAPRGLRRVSLLEEGFSSQGGDATQTERPCEAGSLSENVPQVGIPSTSSIAAEAQRCGVTLPQAAEASSGAGASAATAVPAPRSSCSDEAAEAGSARSPGDRTDSDDEGVRRRCRSPTEARRAMPGHAAAAREAGTSAAGSEAEPRAAGAPSGMGASADGAYLAGHEPPSPDEVCCVRESLGLEKT